MISPPDRAGFADALARKRAQLGSDVIFLQPAIVTFAPGTPLDEDGQPYDPVVQPTASGQASASVRCGVFFKAVNRGGAEHADVDTAIGLDDHTRIFAIAPIEASGQVLGAEALIFHGQRFKITAIKEDEIITNYRRLLVYGAEAA